MTSTSAGKPLVSSRLPLRAAAAVALLLLGAGCAEKECKCDCTGASAEAAVSDKKTAAVSNDGRYAGEVRTLRDGSRVVTLHDGTEITVAESGEVRVTEKNRGSIVVDRRGEVREADRDWQIVVVDGTRKVYSSTTHTVVTEKEYEAIRVGEDTPQKLETAPKALTAPEPGDKVEPDDDDGGRKEKALICHVPPGNPANEHTLSIGAPAVDAHLGHGDYLGECDGRNAGAGKGKGKGKDKDRGDDDDQGHDATKGSEDDGKGKGKDRGHDDDGAASDDDAQKPSGGILQTSGDDDSGKGNRSRGRGRGRSRK